MGDSKGGSKIKRRSDPFPNCALGFTSDYTPILRLYQSFDILAVLHVKVVKEWSEYLHSGVRINHGMLVKIQ